MPFSPHVASSASGIVPGPNGNAFHPRRTFGRSPGSLFPIHHRNGVGQSADKKDHEDEPRSPNRSGRAGSRAAVRSASLARGFRGSAVRHAPVLFIRRGSAGGFPHCSTRREIASSAGRSRSRRDSEFGDSGQSQRPSLRGFSDGTLEDHPHWLRTGAGDARRPAVYFHGRGGFNE